MNALLPNRAGRPAPPLPWARWCAAMLLGGSVAGAAGLGGGCRPDRLPGESMHLTAEERLGIVASPEFDERVVATVGDTVMTVREVERMLEYGSLVSRVYFAEPATRRSALEALVDIRVLALTAEGFFPSDDPEVLLHARLEAARQTLGQVVAEPAVTDADVDAWLAATATRWRSPEVIEMAAFPFAAHEDAVRWHEAMVARTRNHPHGWVAALDTIIDSWDALEEGATRAPWAGNVQRVSAAHSGVPEDVRQALFAEQRLGLREPVSYEGGWVVLWRGLDTPAVIPSDEVVRSRARERLVRERNAAAARALVDNALAGVDVEIDEALVEQLGALRRGRGGQGAQSEQVSRPRLLSAERLSDSPAAILGEQRYRARVEELSALGTPEEAEALQARWLAEQERSDAADAPAAGDATQEEP